MYSSSWHVQFVLSQLLYHYQQQVSQTEVFHHQAQDYEKICIMIRLCFCGVYRFARFALSFSWWRISAANGFVRGRSIKSIRALRKIKFSFIKISLPGDVGGVKRAVIFSFARLLRSPSQRACKPGLAMPLPTNYELFEQLDYFLNC